MSTTEDDSSIPILPSDSPGSSVSTTLQDEYQELLKYAVVAPNYDPTDLPQSLAQAIHAFTGRPPRDELIFEDSSVTTATEESSGEGMPLRRKESTQATQGSTSGESSALSQQDSIEEPAPRSNIPDQVTPVRPGLSGLVATATPETPETDASTLSESDLSRSQVMSPSIDQDLARMEANLDNWCLDLKRGVLAEMSQSKISLLERHRQEMRAAKDRHSREVNQLQNDIESLKELLHTYKVSIERKDGVVSNLTRALQRQKERFEMLRRFEAWKLRHSEDRREAFTSKLAIRQRERRLMTKVWAGWHSLIEAKWKQRVEKACQSKAQEVCMALTNDYETRLASLNEALEAARSEVARLHAERELYEETMKKAFMRGVCALNLEAMTMFHENEENSEGKPKPDDAHPERDSSIPQGVPVLQPSTLSQTVPQPRTVTSQSATTPATLTQTVIGGSGAAQSRGPPKRTAPGYKAAKTVSARISTRPESGRVGSLGGVTLAPPMSSVMVERHHPITQQTIGHAMASQYAQPTVEAGKRSGPTRQPLPSHTRSQPPHQHCVPEGQQPGGAGTAQRKMAGQSGRGLLAASPNVHTVKVVH